MNILSKHSIFWALTISALLPMLVWAESPPPKPDWEIALKGLQKHVAPIIEKVRNHKFAKDNKVSLVLYESNCLRNIFLNTGCMLLTPV